LMRPLKLQATHNITYNISVYLTTVRTQLQDNENMQALNTISKLDKIAYG